MKKMLVLTAVMLCVFASVLFYASDKVTQSWQQPTFDDSSVELSPTVDEMLGDNFKEYKFNEVTEYLNLPQGTNVGSIPLQQQDMISYSEAAAYGGTALENIAPDIAWDEKVFDVYLYVRSVDRSEKENNSGIWYEGHYEDEDMAAAYSVNSQTGDVKYSIVRYKNLVHYSDNPQNVEKAEPGLELSQKLIEKAEDVIKRFGYENEIVYKSVRSSIDKPNNSDENYFNEYSVVFYLKEGNGYLGLQVTFCDNEEYDYPVTMFKSAGYEDEKGMLYWSFL